MSKEKDIDELIKLAQSEGEVKEVNSAERFIHDFVEYSDTEWTHGQAIYWKYLHWFHDNNIGEKPENRDTFFKQMQSFNKKRHATLGYYYSVKEDFFKLSYAEYRVMRGHLRDERDDNKKMKKWKASWKKYRERVAKLNGKTTKKNNKKKQN